jgi:hypothetical protein
MHKLFNDICNAGEFHLVIDLLLLPPLLFFFLPPSSLTSLDSQTCFRAGAHQKLSGLHSTKGMERTPLAGGRYHIVQSGEIMG